ncbi:MAG TPA: cell division protein ZipA C-terminal FtsZ-binding domain-containing protein [Steroidobacteraceae bacterium]
MMSELRWALLILGVLFIVALTFWERRRPRQASGAFGRRPPQESGTEPPPRAVREPPLTLPEVHVHEPLAAVQLPVVETSEETALPMLEPAADEIADNPDGPDSGHEFVPEEPPLTEAQPHRAEEEDTIDDLPTIVMNAERANAEHVDAEYPVETAAIGPAPGPPVLREALPELPPATPLLVEWPAEHERRILALRLVAPQRERFAGRSLRQALAAEGFLLGQFAIFHKPDDEHRAVLSAASLTRPGTFDMETMDSQHYGGLSLFAVLPGPKPARQAFDELVFAARNLNERLHGVLQDEQGTPLTPARIEQLREQFRAGAAS